MSNSKFITFEGLDGSGKTTQIQRAARWMEENELPHITTREPGGTPLGDALRDLLLDPRWSIDPRTEALLYFASRREHLINVIEPALEEGKHVLCDRFTASSFAYQGAGRLLGSHWIDTLDALVTGRRKPDVTIFLDIDFETFYARRGRVECKVDRIEAEADSFFVRAAHMFRSLPRVDPMAHYKRIDANGSVERTWSAVKSALKEVVLF